MGLDLQAIAKQKPVQCPDCKTGYLVSRELDNSDIEIRCCHCDLFKVLPASDEFLCKARAIVAKYYPHQNN
ncbi:MAG: hypothetical protein CEE38_08425 [Planctomycetes bacterium B3_Pla]|nr:MAG: hypothetical protein CEE38_08425 [Planctomycetes bacterium B3_Pla]